ncbi:MAG TPA: hypothetical protein VMU25_00645 [Candidatus Paceibacterota bacterium]|nr:hypothetical protein [Candidatus Paceibacterota bacterium]
MDNQTEILEELKKINATFEYQYSFRKMFWTGIVYGVGFFLGSAILAVILLGVFWPYLSSIPWFRNAFQIGHEVLHQ